MAPPEGIGLYIHVPFCKTKCPYCDFNTYQGIDGLMGRFLEAVTTEISLWGKSLGRPKVQTIFFGGGTPSYLPQGYIRAILDAAHASFEVDKGAETTIEANPGDLDLEACRALLRQGVDRLSIGVQSLDNGLLALLGRRHTADEALDALATARESGFGNVNLDLMYGLPNQSMEQWQATIGRLADHSPEHVSLYALTIEEGTPMHAWLRQGKIPEPDPDLAADMYGHARELLGGRGYHHYEISNWCQPGRECEHNLVYWSNGAYLGVGPGAHSRLGDYRFWTLLSPREYTAQAAQWRKEGNDPWGSFTEQELARAKTVDGWEHIGPDTACSETMFLGLRLLDGLDLTSASQAVGADLATRYHSEIEDLIALGLLEREEESLRLTVPAYLVANQVFTRFIG